MVTLLYGIAALAAVWWVSQLFARGNPAVLARTFKLTGGAYARFDASAPGALANLMRAAAAYASGGVAALQHLAASDGKARALLTSMQTSSARRS